MPHLRPKERELLEILVENKDVPLSAFYDVCSDRAVKVHLCHLRKKLGIIIYNVHGKCYYLGEDSREKARLFLKGLREAA